MSHDTLPSSAAPPDFRWGSEAYLLAGAVLGLARLVYWGLVTHRVSAAAWFDAGHWLSVGGLVAGANFLGSKSGASLRVRLLVGYFFCFVLGLTCLADDVTHFSTRQEFVPASLAYYGVVTVISAGPMLAAALGIWLRTSYRPFLVLVGCLFGLGANDALLKNDYFGVHLFIALSLVCGLGAALTMQKRPAILRERRVPLLVLSASLSLAALTLQPSVEAAGALSQSTGAAFSRFLVRNNDTKNSQESANGENSSLTGPRAEWYRSRAHMPDVAPTSPSPLPKNPLVVLLTIDALRADVVLSGKHDALLPNLARLRSGGVSFTQARTPGALTKVSMASLFLGNYFSQQYWSQMKKRKAGVLNVQEDDSTRFPELLVRGGVKTLNVRSINWLRNGVILRGFQVDNYVPYPAKKSYYTPSPPIMKEILKRLSPFREADAPPAFLFSHLSDPHAPYDQGKTKKGAVFERYLSEVELVDRELGRLLRFLESDSVRSRVLLIVSADHGEAFGEHNSTHHGTTLYEEGIHVPLLLWRPDGRARTVDELVSLIDLGPTILDAFRLKTPAAHMGQSLLGFLNNPESGSPAPSLTRPIITETRLMRSLVTPDKMKLIFDTRSGLAELYDLNTDPKELKNLAGKTEVAKPLLDQLNAFFAVHQIRREGYEPPYLR